MVAATGSMTKATEGKTSAASSTGGKGGASSGAGSSTGNQGSGAKSSAGAAAAAAQAAASAQAAADAAHAHAAAAAQAAKNNTASAAQAAASLAAEARDKAQAATAMGQRGLLGGGSILSNPTAAARSIGGLLGAAKGPTQYGPGSEIGANRYGQALAVSKGPVSDWADAGRLDQKIALDQALVGLARDQARKNLLGPTLDNVPVTTSRRPNGLSFRSVGPLGRTLDPFNAGVVTHWTNGTGLESNYGVNIGIDGSLHFTQPISPSGMQVTNHAAGLNRSNIGVASLGLNPNRNQLAAGSDFGSFMQGVNPNAQITSHGYMAGTLGKERGLPGGYTKVANEGVALADAIAGQPTTRGGFAPDRAPTLSDAVQTAAAPPANIPGTGYQENPARFAGIAQPQPKMQDRLSPAYTSAAMAQNGLGPMQGGPAASPGLSQAAYGQRGVPSPMAGQGIPGPAGLSDMADLAGRSPVGAVSQRQTVGQVNPSGYFGGPGFAGVSQAPFNTHGVPSPMAGQGVPGAGLPGFNDYGARNPVGAVAERDTLGRPNPSAYGGPPSQTAGMSFNPGLPRNPETGMAFNPGLPGQMPGNPRSRSPGVSAEPQVAANGIPNQPGLESRTPQPNPFAGLENIFPKKNTQVADAGKPMDITPKIGPLQNYPQPYMGETYTFSVPGRPAGTRRSVEPDSMVTKGALTTAIGLGTGVPGSGLALDALQTLGHMARQGRVGNRPGQPYANGMDHADTYNGGVGGEIHGGGPDGQWTGQEAPSKVARMQQNVEQVLRNYFVQLAGQMYPSYATGTA